MSRRHAGAALALAGFAWGLAVAPEARAQQPAAPAQAPVETLVLSPEPGERVPQDAVLVAASFVDRDGRLDPGTIVVQVDGRDVTAEARVSAEVVTWTPRQPLPPGPHRVAVLARDRSGAALGAREWAFTVEPAAAAETGGAAPRSEATGTPAWTRLQGSITFEGSALSVSGPGADFRRNEDQVPRLWLNAGGLLGGSWRYAARVHVSGYESSDRQPVNRYRFDIRSDHLSASLGDVNPVVQSLMLAGTRVRGLEADLRFGPARLTVVKGRSRRDIPGVVDPLDPAAILRGGTYGRDLLAVRPALGGRTLQVGLTYLRVQDEVGSIPELRVVRPGGTSTRVNPLPKDNAVAGADLTVRLLDGRVLLQYENAFSLLANDITTGPLTEPQLDSILDAAGFDPIGIDPSDYADFFTVNASMIPLDPRGMTSFAQQARTSLRTGTNILSIEWRSIGGSYHSLGHPSLIRDRRGFRIRDSFTLLDDALALSAGVERDQDNLDDVKPASTTTTGVFATASWQRSPTSPTVVASARQGTRANDLPANGSGALDETSLALSLGLSYPVVVFDGFRTRLNLNVSSITRDDPANPTVESSDRYVLGGIQGETLDRGTELAFLYGRNASELSAFAGARTDFHRALVDVRHRLRPRWTAHLDGTFTAARSPAEAGGLGLDYDRTEVMVGGEFEWAPASFVSLEGGIVDYGDGRDASRDTREVVTRIRLHRAF